MKGVDIVSYGGNVHFPRSKFVEINLVKFVQVFFSRIRGQPILSFDVARDVLLVQ